MARRRSVTAAAVVTTPSAAMAVNIQKGSGSARNRKASTPAMTMMPAVKMGRSTVGALSGTMASARWRSSASLAGYSG